MATGTIVAAIADEATALRERGWTFRDSIWEALRQPGGKVVTFDEVQRELTRRSHLPTAEKKRQATRARRRRRAKQVDEPLPDYSYEFRVRADETSSFGKGDGEPCGCIRAARKEHKGV